MPLHLTAQCIMGIITPKKYAWLYTFKKIHQEQHTIQFFCAIFIVYHELKCINSNQENYIMQMV